jgi:glycosyltransferase involved in cell wall biosynthesis
MTIVSVAYPLLPVSADSAGGAEQVLWLVERELAAEGHRSIVIAAEGSRISGDLVPTPVCEGEMTDKVRQQAQATHRHSIEQVLKQNSVDLVHFHGLDFHAYVPHSSQGAAMLTTLHLPLAWYASGALDIPGMNFNCVSASQASGHSFPVVQNGIDINRYGAGEGKREDFLLFLGRICPEKGGHIALDVAHRLDRPMFVAGPVFPFRDHQRYFTREVEPLLDERRIYLGGIGFDQKLELLRRTACVLIPSLAAETSSLVAMEACSASTPVVAFRSGALPEVVEHRVTGFVVDSAGEMAEAVGKCAYISSERCLQTALTRFDSRRMARDYIELYRNILTEQTESLPISSHA